uniref:Uncharacterized protein n=1 Tax=Rhizophora mucronata TaxID=61149 RepID=A0A2P2K997_RHIMU
MDIQVLNVLNCSSDQAFTYLGQAFSFCLSQLVCCSCIFPPCTVHCLLLQIFLLLLRLTEPINVLKSFIFYATEGPKIIGIL